LSFDKSLKEVTEPNIRMIPCVCAYKLVKVFSDNKTFISDSFDDAWNYYNINFFVFVKFFLIQWRWNFVNWIKNNLDNLFWDWKQLDALVDQIFFQKRSEWLYFLKWLWSELIKWQFFQLFEKLFRIWNLVENFQLVGFRLKFGQRYMIGRNESASFLVRMLGRFLDEDFTLLNGDELWTGGVLRALTIWIFIILVFPHLLFLCKVILHDHFKQVRKFLTFNS